MSSDLTQCQRISKGISCLKMSWPTELGPTGTLPYQKLKQRCLPTDLQSAPPDKTNQLAGQSRAMLPTGLAKGYDQFTGRRKCVCRSCKQCGRPTLLNQVCQHAFSDCHLCRCMLGRSGALATGFMAQPLNIGCWHFSLGNFGSQPHRWLFDRSVHGHFSKHAPTRS